MRDAGLAGGYIAAGGLVLFAAYQLAPPGAARTSVVTAGAALLVLVLSWRFLSDRSTAFVPPAFVRDKETSQQRDTRWTRDTVLILCYVGATGLVLFAIRALVPAGGVESFFRVLGAGVLLACGSLVTGSLLGFLFGIPRAQAAAGVPPASPEPAEPGTAPFNGPSRRASRIFQVNTNLEQISDWLTKIIVGLGLINLGRIPDEMARLASYFAQGFGPIEGRDAVAMAIIVAFGVSGFLLGYLLTRLFLTGAFTRAESALEELEHLIEAAGSPSGGGPPVAEGPAPAGSGTPPPGIDPAQVAAALRVGQIAGQLGRGQVREQLLSLVHEYNVTRAAMPYSQHRTQLLDGVVARMRVLSAAAGWMLPQLIRAGTPGERLAAIAILQMQPDPAFVTWLEERCHTEQAFLQYHAAIALRNAADSLGEEHHPALRLSIERALAKSRDSSTRKVLESAQEILAGAGASGAA